MISVISSSLKGTTIISIMPSLVSYTKSIARLCPLSLSQQNPPISLHALTPVKPHLLSPGQASWFLLCLCQPAFHIYADLFINVHYQQVRPQFKATRGLPIAFRVNTHKALQGPDLPNGALPALQLHLKHLSFLFSGLPPKRSLTISNVPYSFLLQVLPAKHLP